MKRDQEKIAHLNTRIRAMKSLLFSRRQCDDLLEQDDLGLFTEVLLASPYEVHMAEALARYRGADAIEEALSRALVADFAKVQRLSDGCFEVLADVFFQRWDLAAVKSLLRHCHQRQTVQTKSGPFGRPFDKLRTGFRAGPIRMVADLANAPAFFEHRAGCLIFAPALQ